MKEFKLDIKPNTLKPIEMYDDPVQLGEHPPIGKELLIEQKIRHLQRRAKEVGFRLVD